VRQRGRGTEAGGGIALRVEVEQERAEAASGQAGREIGGGRRFADAALLIGHAENPSHTHIPSKRQHTHNACSRSIGSNRPGMDVVSRETALIAYLAQAFSFT
jgi:hypothetical protein